MVDAPDRAPFWVLSQYDDVRVPLTNVQGGGLSPTFGKFQDNGAGSTGVYAWLFGNVGAPDLAFAVQLPHGYEEGTDLIAHLHLSPTTADAGTIRMGLEYTIVNEQGGAFPQTTIVTADVAAGGVALAHLRLVLDTITGTGLKISAMLLGRVFRDNTVGGNYGQDVAVHEFDMHILKNTLGSNLPLVKNA